ncbi:MAG: thiol-activated cytolysin family protein [Spirochaetaceae bacterium]|jgi:hypothetical protein|nr:thiol-activated cytolysin family protein [Spirochaetaceae bacterium]
MKKFILFTILTVFIWSCDMFTPVETTDSAEDNTGTTTLLVKGDAQPQESYEASSPREVSSDRDDFICYERRVTETRNMTEIANLGQNDDILYPGALIIGTGAASGSLTPALLPYGISRKPVTLSLGGISGVTTDVTISDCTPSLSSTRTAINTKLTELVGASAAARIEMSKEEVYSQEQFSMSLGIGATWPAGQSLESQVDLTSSEEKSRIVVNFKQVYYSVDMDTPTGLSDMFEGGDAATIDSFIAENDPLYVSRVFYGRQVFFIMESTCSSEELTVAVEGAMQAGGVETAPEVSGTLALSNEQILANTSIKAIIYGGSTDGAMETLSGYSGLVSFLQQGAEFDATTGSNALPLYYQMRFVEDNKIGALTSNAEYTIREYVRTKQRVSVAFETLKCTGDDDGLWDDTVEIKGNLRARAMNSSSSVGTDWMELHDNWGSYWAMSNGTTKTINNQVTLAFTALDADQSYIELNGHFSEDDSAGDDDMGTKTRTVMLTEGWNESYKLYFEEDGASVEATFKLTILP